MKFHRDVIDATEEQIDEFLDYCERTIPPSEELTKSKH